jgi:hypothetical protein
MVAKEQDNFAEIAELMSERKRLTQELADIEVKLYSLHRLEGLRSVSVGNKVQPRVSASKKEQHDARAKRAKAEGITPHELMLRESAKELGFASAGQYETFTLEQRASALKAGMTMEQYWRVKAEENGCSVNQIKAVLAKAWKGKKRSRQIAPSVQKCS